MKQKELMWYKAYYFAKWLTIPNSENLMDIQLNKDSYLSNFRQNYNQFGYGDSHNIRT